MIGYGKSGASMYPEMGVINCDDAMNWSSPVSVKSSPTYIDDGSLTSRWGDYSGTARKHNSNVPSIWMSGSIANIGNYWISWISEIHEVTVGINEIANSPVVNAKIYPNPASNIFHLEFSMTDPEEIAIDIFDVEGRLVKDLYRGRAYEGVNEFSFYKNNLTPGVYFLSIKGDNGVLKNEKIVITD